MWGRGVVLEASLTRLEVKRSTSSMGEDKSPSTLPALEHFVQKSTLELSNFYKHQKGHKISYWPPPFQVTLR